ncbi:hypothetical protein P256_00509 [Acinetobacter nectaris CIP 110549]|uniref:Pseudouridine synthase n=1 Tax=Acinetobacter nectaris CIP 110549 TaxID=1392540 RepID=V2TV81_9GAMM|nr:pseudouridine synthase [Acinetobacter nectaris]ESK40070.1 hypothetical protein P256_00509 [Acinetobacter nectaris CIP 110549]
MRLDKILQSQGFGSRKVCQQLIARGLVEINGETCRDPKAVFQPVGLVFNVSGESYNYAEKLYILLNKPKGYECSHEAVHHFSVYELIPPLFNARGVQSIGRLDQDTTGLLIFSDDGQFIQALTHPKKHVGKQYLVQVIDPLTDEQLKQLEDGVSLKGEKGLFVATDVKQLSDHEFLMTVHQGVYHQVKRMIAAIDNKVSTLHRNKIGAFELPHDLNEGEWQYLSFEEIQRIKS